MEPVRESICKRCANKRICSSAILEARNSYMTACSRFEEAKPQTNADRIRGYTDEELANALAHKADACWNCSSDSLDICKDCWLDWLKQEVHNG